MNRDPHEVIQSELEPGERLIWAAQPVQGIKFRTIDFFGVPFSILWAGFAFYWEYSVIKGGAPFMFVLFGVPFVLIGVYVTVGRFFLDAWLRSKTYYGLTNDRVVIVSGLWARKVNSLSLRTLTDVSLVESATAVGSISFGRSSMFNSMFAGVPWPGAEQYIGPRFDLIEDAKRTFQKIREAQKAAA